MLNDELAHAYRRYRACSMGRSSAWRPIADRCSIGLLFRRDWPHFIAFDVLSINEAWPLRQRRLTTSWLKIRNPGYSQIEGRPELSGTRKPGSRSESARPVLCSELQALRHAAF
jgi:hypothetical protein